MKRLILALVATGMLAFAQLPHAIPDGYELPNGWRLTPLGRAIPTEDMVLNVSLAPDRKAVVALHSGFNPHGLVVVDAHSEEAAQRIPLKSAWLGLAWHPNGKRLYVSGGNANGKNAHPRAHLHLRLRERPPLERAVGHARRDHRYLGALLVRPGASSQQASALRRQSRHRRRAEQRRRLRYRDRQAAAAHPGGGQPVRAGAQRQRPDALRLQLGQRFGQRHRRQHAARHRPNRRRRQSQRHGAFQGRPPLRLLLQRQHRRR